MRSILLIFLFVAFPAFGQRPNPRSTGWYTDYATARAEAKRTGKPLFVAFRCEP